MQTQSLTEIATERMSAARATSSGRASHTVYGGHANDLRQTLIALTAGHGLHEHDAPAEATLQVLSGTVRMDAGNESWTGHPGDHLAIPHLRHDLRADTDAVVLLTVAVRAQRADAVS